MTYKSKHGQPWLYDDTGAIVGVKDGVNETPFMSAAEVAAVRGLAPGNKLVSVTLLKLMRSPLKASVLGNSYSVPFGPQWFREACARSGGLLVPDVVAGVAGNTTTQMLARLSDIPATTDVCFVFEGPNDANQAVTPASHYANLMSICNGLIAKTVLPILVLAPPSTTNYTSISKYRVVEYHLAQVLGIPCIDPFYDDFDVTTGGWISGYSLDGTHPIIDRYVAAGTNVVAQLQSPPASIPWARHNLEYGGHASNCLFLNATSGLATGWSATSGASVSNAAASESGVLGNWQTISASAASTNQMLWRDLSLPAYTAGDTVQVACKIKATNTSNSMFAVFVRWKNSSGGGIRDDAAIYNSTLASFAGFQWLQYFVIPAGTASAQVYAYIGPSGGNATGSLSIAQLQVQNLSALIR